MSARKNSWTPERRAAQAARIRETKPWLKSTGPKTKQGKARCSKNAIKHGSQSAVEKATRKVVTANKKFLLVADVLLHETAAALNRSLARTDCKKDQPKPEG